MVDIDLDPGCTLNKKIRNAQLAQYNFILGKKGDLPKTACQTLGNLETWRWRLKGIVIISSLSSPDLKLYVCSVDTTKEHFGLETWKLQVILKGLSKNLLPFTSYFSSGGFVLSWLD